MAESPWQDATVTAVRTETERARTIRLRLERPEPHLAGQHYIVRLTAPDGYTAVAGGLLSVDEAKREGQTTFDFLRGAEEYKYAWGATDRMNRRRQWIRT